MFNNYYDNMNSVLDFFLSFSVDELTYYVYPINNIIFT